VGFVSGVGGGCVVVCLWVRGWVGDLVVFLPVIPSAFPARSAHFTPPPYSYLIREGLKGKSQQYRWESRAKNTRQTTLKEDVQSSGPRKIESRGIESLGKCEMDEKN